MHDRRLVIAAGALLVLAAAGALAVRRSNTAQPDDSYASRDTTSAHSARSTPEPIASNASSVLGERASAVGEWVTLHSRIVSNTHEPMSPASVIWSALTAPEERPAAEWPEANWQEIEANSKAATCGADGSFDLDVPRAVLQSRYSVLWIIHPLHKAKSLILAPCGDATRPCDLPNAIELDPCGALTARVLGPDQTPVAGATVYELFEVDEV